MDEQSEQLNPYMEEIFKEMFRRVGIEYDPLLMEQDDWFETELWSVADENDFCQWMFERLSNDKDAMLSLFGVESMVEQVLRDTISMFVLNFGWGLYDFVPEWDNTEEIKDEV